MRARCLLFAALILAAAPLSAQQTKRGAARPAGSRTDRPAADLSQLMKGIFYPASNVIFAAQNDDPATIAPAKDPSTATDPLQSAYGKWQAVENAALTLTDAAPLLLIPGRVCSNGKPAPLAKPDWNGLVRGLREAGLKVYEAAKAKDQDKILDAADAMTTACANCHDKYRDVPQPADRCR